MVNPNPGDALASRPAAGRIAIATVLTDDYLPGFAVLAHTFKKQNPGFEIPFYIFYSPKFAPLSKEGQNLVLALQPGARLTEVDDSKYASLWQSCVDASPGLKSSKPALLLLEAFALPDYSQVFVLHTDLLCMGSLEELFTLQTDFAAVYPVREKVPAMPEAFDTGVMVIGAAHLTGATHAKLLRHSVSSEFRTGSWDHLILNDYFRNADICRLPLNLNTGKRKFPDRDVESIDDVRAEGTRLLHFEGEKPWQPHSSLPESRFHILESHWCEELCAALGPIAKGPDSSLSGRLAKEILERTVPRLAAGISAQSESEFRSRVRTLTKRAESAEESYHFAIRALREIATDPASMSNVSTEPVPELWRELEVLREECSRAQQRSVALGKENAALSRTLRTWEQNQLKLKRQLEKMRQRDAHNKAVLKAFEALASYSIKVADRLENLSGRMLLWLFKKRLRNWAAVLRRLAVPPEEAQMKESSESKQRQRMPAAETDEHVKARRRETYLESGEFARLSKLQNLHLGRRCFILGEGTSLERQDLRLLENEVVIATDRSVMTRSFSKDFAGFYCISNPELFGGWDRPRLASDLYQAMQEKAKGAMKLFPFALRDCVRQAGLFAKESVFYALFQPPSFFVDLKEDIEFDFSRHLLDGYSTVFSIAVPLAVHLGCSEIILLGCSPLSTDKDQSFSRACEIIREKLASRAIHISDATADRRIGTITAVEYAALFPPL